ncbi:MAG: D-glycero-beta-D-manno-heptose 1,7-bisphosphate 7-phosphatase [Lachnospiraceae bacterium]|nr:D-glycero-beta-D-manno-heptose 1,7-bisphosphate 7-phosphatase [Lachnospiraceae bacterium]
MQAVIMAGGKGTRIASVANDVPKPMIQICGKPILQYQIECLRSQDIRDIILVIGHLGDIIKKYFGDGSRFHVNISYIEEREPLGTAGALYYLKGDVHEDFILLNGDIIFDVDFVRFMDYHKMKGAYATIFTHPNNHPYDSGLVVTDQEGIVTIWMHKEDERTIYKNRVNAGIHILSVKLLEMFQEARKADLDRDVLKKLISDRLLAAYDSPEYVRDMGTPDRFEMVTRDIESGLVHAKNLKNKQKAIFLDRDGTINIYKGFINDHEEMELIPGIAEQIRKINESGYLAIVVTNQPVIARGECSVEELERIHEKMETLLGQEGAYIDDLFYCPHHPDKGFEGERVEYKVECECRKPKPGMLLQAAEKYNIDLSASYMVGDDERDMEAGKRVGCKVVKTERNVAVEFKVIESC